MNASDRFSYVIVEQKDVLYSNLDDLTIEGVTDVLNKRGDHPKAVLLFTVCLHHFLGSDLKYIYRKLEERFPDICFIRCYMDPIMKKLAKFTLFLPARIVLFLYTEFTGDNFWEIWSAIKSGAYHDEKMKKYASKELELYRKIFIEGPIAPVTTSDFLSQDGYFTFWETPSELVGEENYYISDWDRLYWWGKIEDVEITEEIDIWLNMLVKEYEMILKGKEQETENAFVDHIFNTMEYLNSFYGRIYLFKEFYNALLNNSHEVRYQAILDLLDKFGEKNKEIGRVYQKYGNKEWCILSKNLKCNRGRMEIKRIIGVMANKELRKKYFGF